MRLIDADALLEELAGDYNNLEGMPHDLEAAVYAIMDAPTIDFNDLAVDKEMAKLVQNAIEHFLWGLIRKGTEVAGNGTNKPL